MSIEAAGSPGGDASASPIGTTPAGGNVPTTPSAEPSVIEVGDESLIKPRGYEKPVKFSDYRREFQSQFTRASQEAARLRQALQERDARLQRFEQEKQAAARQSAQRGEQDAFDALRQLPYLSGEAAAEVIQDIAGQIGRRDQIILGLAKELQKVQRMVGTLHETHTSSAFESRIDGVIRELGYDSTPEIRNLAQELYLAYEPGPELDEAFPRMLQERIDQLDRFLTARKEAKLRASRPAPFIPGRGGEAKPSKPLQIPGDASAKEVADLMWDAMNGKAGT